MPAKFIPNQAGIREFIRTPDGPVYRYLMVLGHAVKAEFVASLKEGFPKDFLGPTCVVRTTSAGVWVGIDHTKTQPHMIYGNPILTFYWKRVGRVVHFASVNHPGSDLHNYAQIKLSEALEVVGRL